MLAPQQVKVILPPLHEKQKIFGYWNIDNPEAHVLVAPCGTKLGKSFGSAWWMAVEAMTNAGLFCVWIAPTYRKAKIGFRYIKAFLPDCEFVETKESLEIKLANGSYITFIHGKDAEITVEGEAVDRFVIDEAGKIVQQVWTSLITTITQTRGKGIVTGTPRGHGWYYKLFQRARKDPFFMSVTLRTADSPYVTAEAIEMAKRLLPDHLYQQYYEARFISQSTVFGDLTKIWREELDRDGKISTWTAAGMQHVETQGLRFWLDPDPKKREGVVVHGVDLAKQRDYTVFYSVNSWGQLVGYVRFRKVDYPVIARRFEDYVTRFFPKCENVLRYDATGVGVAVGDFFNEVFDDNNELDIMIDAVTFTNKLKSHMVTQTILAMEQGWHKVPRIEQIETEYTAYEVVVTKTGAHRYEAGDGEHDDIVSAGIMAVSYAYTSEQAEQAQQLLDDAMGDKKGHTDSITEDELTAYAEVISEESSDDFFDNDERDIDFDEENA